MAGILTILRLQPGAADLLPYHGGHTVYFEEATMYLCNLNETGAIVDNPGEMYFEAV
jgi:hypothetical protein